MPCPRGNTNLSTSASQVQIQRSSGGFPCELGVTVTGELGVDDRSTGFDGRACRTRFSQRLDGFFLAEAPLKDGSATVRQDGKLSVDALGDLLFATREDQGPGAPTPNPSSGSQPATYQLPAGQNCPIGGTGVVQVRRPPLRTGNAPLQARAAAAATPAMEFRQRLQRATNGQVYQIVQNVNDLSNFGSEAIQITTLVASEDGGVGECAFTAGATVFPQAVAAVEPGKAFPLDRIRKSQIIPFADEPFFNRNGAAGNGLVCVGPGCAGGASCQNPATCRTFTIGDGLPIDAATAGPDGGIPAANLLPALPTFENTIGCTGFEGLTTYRFGLDGPTVEKRQCTTLEPPPQGDGFRLHNGESVIFAYNASFASLFNAAVAGFPIDVDGSDIIGCGPGGNQVLHLGVSELDSVEPPVVRFAQSGNQPQVILDFLGNNTQVQTITGGCSGFSALSECE